MLSMHAIELMFYPQVRQPVLCDHDIYLDRGPEELGELSFLTGQPRCLVKIVLEQRDSRLLVPEFVQPRGWQ